jgi:hypothetical protein
MNQLAAAILALIPIMLQHIENQELVKNIPHEIALVDAFPIMLCSGKRSARSLVNYPITPIAQQKASIIMGSKCIS